MKEFISWGVMGEWKTPYKTMDSTFVKNQIELFQWLLSQGYIYQRYMPVYWSPSSKTALAESELEYNAKHQSTAIYTRFKITKNDHLAEELFKTANIWLLVWTTTPWSLVANRAVCFNPKLEYCFVKHPLSEDFYIVAVESLQNKELKEIFGEAPEIKDVKLTEHDLSRLTYTDSLFAGVHCVENTPILPATHVTKESGTGLVHTAPAHGQEDYLVGVSNELDLSCPIDEHGCYDQTVPTNLRGLFALDAGSKEVLTMLDEGQHILAKDIYIHSYPYDWRTKKPVMLRASKQWFMDTGNLQPKALEALKNVDIHPKTSVNGFRGVLDKRPYWCISRQRVWGVPIPVFYNTRGDVLISQEMVEKYKELIDIHGSDFWWKLSTKEILEGLNVEDLDNLIKSSDILDVWFDSGITWHNIIEGDSSGSLKQSDVYLEGLDQFSGWFYSSLLTSVAVQNAAPYKKLYVHGFTMDETGRKMSKSLGNVISPTQITQGWSTETETNEKPVTKKSNKSNKKSSIVFGVDVLR